MVVQNFVKQKLTCESCGSQNFMLIRNFWLSEFHTIIAPCECGERKDRVATRFKYHTTTIFSEWCLWQQPGQPKFTDREIVEELGETVDVNLVFCSNCTESAQESDWVAEINCCMQVEEKIKYFVNCLNCWLEINIENLLLKTDIY